MRLTVIQTNPRILDVKYNLEAVEKKLNRVRGDIILLPELCSSGYFFRNKEEITKVAENAKSGPTSKLLQKIAAKKKCVIVAGFPEAHRSKFFNSALIVFPNKIFVYRKRNLFFKEKKVFTAGSRNPSVYQWKNTRFGVMICFDWFYPEVARSLALKGADLVLHPSNLVLPYAPKGMQTRSLENFVFSATANRVGRERGLTFIGQSQILNKKGKILGRLSGKKEGVLSIPIDPSESRNKKITPYNDILKDLTS